MGEIAEQNEYGNEDDAISDEPFIWTDHTGRRWQLSEMSTSHLIFINRLVVNQWASALGLQPVPIKKSIAVFNPNRTPDQIIEVARRARRMAEEVLRRLDEGEQLEDGLAVVWERVISKIQECLRKLDQSPDHRLLNGTSRILQQGDATSHR